MILITNLRVKERVREIKSFQRILKSKGLKIKLISNLNIIENFFT
jgi:hypothetical protein